MGFLTRNYDVKEKLWLLKLKRLRKLKVGLKKNHAWKHKSYG